MCHTESTVCTHLSRDIRKRGKSYILPQRGKNGKNEIRKVTSFPRLQLYPGSGYRTGMLVSEECKFFYLKASMNPDTTTADVVLETADDEPQSIEAEPLTTDSRR